MAGEYKAFLTYFSTYSPVYFVKEKELEFCKEFIKRLRNVLQIESEKYLLLQDFEILSSISLFMKMVLWQDQADLLLKSPNEVVAFLKRVTGMRTTSRYQNCFDKLDINQNINDSKARAEEHSSLASSTQVLSKEEEQTTDDALTAFKAKLKPLKIPGNPNKRDKTITLLGPSPTNENAQTESENNILAEIKDKNEQLQLSKLTPSQNCQFNIQLCELHEKNRNKAFEKVTKAIKEAASAKQQNRLEMEKWHVSLIISHFKTAARENNTLLLVLDKFNTEVQYSHLKPMKQNALMHKEAIVHAMNNWSLVHLKIEEAIKLSKLKQQQALNSQQVVVLTVPINNELVQQMGVILQQPFPQTYTPTFYSMTARLTAVPTIAQVPLVQNTMVLPLQVMTMSNKRAAPPGFPIAPQYARAKAT